MNTFEKSSFKFTIAPCSR